MALLNLFDGKLSLNDILFQDIPFLESLKKAQLKIINARKTASER